MPASSAPPQYCLLNWGRLNAFPINYTSAQLFGSIGGVALDPASQSILIDSLSVSDRLNEEPNTLIATVRGARPVEGQTITMGLGSTSGMPLFAGRILRVTRVWAADNPARVLHHVEATDPTWELNAILITARYRSQSASTIGAALLAFAPAGFTGNIQANLPQVDEITMTNTTLMDAFVQLAHRIGGYAFCDYACVIHLFVGERLVSPAPLVASHPSLAGVSYTRDLTQIVTRAVVEGGGSNALARLTPGSTEIPVEDAAWYSASGGLVTSGPQRIQYTGTRAGGAGSLVGSGGSPTSAPVVEASASGGSVTLGGHAYAYSWVSSAGETLVAPAANITISSAPPIGVAPSVAVADGAGSLPVGTYHYAVTHVTDAGETAPSPGLVSAVCTPAVPSPLAPPTVRPNPGFSTNIAGRRDGVIFRVSYRSTTGVSPAIYGPPSAKYWFPDTAGNPAESCIVTVQPVTSTGGAIYADLHMQNQSTDNVWRQLRVGFPVPVAPAGGTDLVMGTETAKPNPPVDTGGFPHSVVTVTVNDGGAGVTARKVYRTKVGGVALYLLRQVSGSAQTSFVDTTADSALVTAPPSVVGAAQTVTVSGIAPGPHGSGSGLATIARKVYRTPADSGVLKLLTTLNDNTTTTFVDTQADAVLGAGIPTTDTASLVADAGQALAGATTLPVSGMGPFPSTGGWVLTGNNRVHYAGVTATTLTDIPASGEGSIANTIPYGTPVTLAPSLTGIPTSGAGAIAWAILAGDPVNLLVIVDDGAAQAALAAALGGGTGIREALIQDGRIGIAEARARGTAYLAAQSRVVETVAHKSRDRMTRAGALVTVDLPAPTDIHGTYRIQDVGISRFNPHAGIAPTFDARSSSSRYTLEDLLRQIASTDAPPTTGETS